MNGPIRLAYDVQGRGEPMLLIAGTMGDRSNWALVREVLARRYQTIAFAKERRHAAAALGGRAGTALLRRTCRQGRQSASVWS